MELLNEETGNWLHDMQRHPYSQHIQYEGTKVYWTISVLTAEAYERIIVPLLSVTLQELNCTYHQMIFAIIHRELTTIGEKEFLEKYYFCDSSRTFTIDFVTPTSFKSNGKYMNYPSVRWIFQSLMHKHDANIDGNQVYDEEVLQLMEEQIVVTQYNLRSTFFYLEGVKIPAFKGQIKICVKSDQMVVNLVHYLLKYGEFSGVGIKSAIGMGAIKIQSKERKGR